MRNLIKKILKESELRFGIGQKVRLSPDSRFFADGHRNPHSEHDVGRVIEVDSYVKDFHYKVKWDAGYDNWYREVDLIPGFNYDLTNDLFDQLNESDEYEWIEDTLNSMPNPYQMEGQEFIDFMNKYFQSNPSPKLERTYRFISDVHGLALKDHTGAYFHMRRETMDNMVYHIEEYLSRSSSRRKKHITEEFEDLYSTIKPLIDTYK